MIDTSGEWLQSGLPLSRLDMVKNDEKVTVAFLFAPELRSIIRSCFAREGIALTNPEHAQIVQKNSAIRWEVHNAMYRIWHTLKNVADAMEREDASY